MTGTTQDTTIIGTMPNVTVGGVAFVSETLTSGTVTWTSLKPDQDGDMLVSLALDKCPLPGRMRQPLELWADKTRLADLLKTMGQRVLVHGVKGVKGVMVESVEEYSGEDVNKAKLTGIVVGVSSDGLQLEVPDGISSRTSDIGVVQIERQPVPKDSPALFPLMLIDAMVTGLGLKKGPLVRITGVLHGSGEVTCRYLQIDVVRRPANHGRSDGRSDWEMRFDGLAAPNDARLVGFASLGPFVEDGPFRRVTVTQPGEIEGTEVLIHRRNLGPARRRSQKLFVFEGFRSRGNDIVIDRPVHEYNPQEEAATSVQTIGGRFHRTSDGGVTIRYCLGAEMPIEGLDDTSDIEEGALVAAQLTFRAGRWVSKDGKLTSLVAVEPSDA
jgi:hypothetical protein